MDADELNPYDLEPVADDAPYPPPLPTARPVAGVACVGCGYALDGLKEDGVCPECGMPIRRSLSGDLLKDANPAYVESLDFGALLVYWGLVATVVLWIVRFLVPLFVAVGGLGSFGLGGFISSYSFQLLTSLVGVAVSLVSLFGWWKLSSPDPRHGLAQQSAARRVLRVCVVLQATCAVFGLLVQGMSGVSASLGAALFGLLSAYIFVYIGSWIAMFISSMFYLAGLAPRIPNDVIRARAKLYVWLLPVVSIVGACVIYLGPLIAFLMYARLVQRVHEDLQSVQREQRLLDAAGLV